jgi:hypothetical protein
MLKTEKPLGHKAYGRIPHLPGSRVGPSDYQANPGHVRIATEAFPPQRKHDRVIVSEKLDGTNVSCYRRGNEIIPLTRAGYRAETSPYEQHWMFAAWVKQHEEHFLHGLEDGQRFVGEWLAQAHGTRYSLRPTHYRTHSLPPFYIFDLMIGQTRMPWEALISAIAATRYFTLQWMPHLLHVGEPLSIEKAVALLGLYGRNAATDPAEGCIWRVETRKRATDPYKVDFLVKFVRPGKVDGCYLPEISGCEPVWNWRPEEST